MRIGAEARLQVAQLDTGHMAVGGISVASTTHREPVLALNAALLVSQHKQPDFAVVCDVLKEKVGRALLTAQVTPRWEGQRAATVDPHYGPVKFGEVRGDVKDRHGIDLLPLALSGEALPKAWLNQQQEGYNKFVQGLGGWSGVAKNSSNRIVAVTPDDMRAVYGEILQVVRNIRKDQSVPSACVW